MKHWLFLALAIVAEVVATTSLKASDGFQKPGPSLLVINLFSRTGAHGA